MQCRTYFLRLDTVNAGGAPPERLDAGAGVGDFVGRVLCGERREVQLGI